MSATDEAARPAPASDAPVIESVDTAVYVIPTDAPEADGTLSWDKTTMVLVTVRAGGPPGGRRGPSGRRSREGRALRPGHHGQGSQDRDREGGQAPVATPGPIGPGPSSRLSRDVD